MPTHHTTLRTDNTTNMADWVLNPNYQEIYASTRGQQANGQIKQRRNFSYPTSADNYLNASD